MTAPTIARAALAVALLGAVGGGLAAWMAWRERAASPASAEQLDGGRAGAVAPAPAPGEPWLSVSFDATTTAAWRRNPFPKYAPERQTIDTANPMPGARASVRFDYVPATPRDAWRCDDHSIGFTPIGDGAPARFPRGTREVWVEYWERYSPGFDTRPPWECPRSADRKVHRVLASPYDDRAIFGLNVGIQGGAFVGQMAAGHEQVYASNLRGPDVWTGRWVRWRMHYRLSGSRERTGAAEAWVSLQGRDGRMGPDVKLVASGSGYNQVGPDGPGVPYDGSAVTTMHGLTGRVYEALDIARVGLNMNLHPARPQSVWVGAVHYWLDPPDWAAGPPATALSPLP